MLTICSCNDEGKTVVCWGDSLTAPWNRPSLTRGYLPSMMNGTDYPYYLQDMLGDDYDVVNAAVSGENTLTIMGRQGAYPMLLAHDVTIPRSNKKKFKTFIGNNDSPAFISAYNGLPLTPFIQASWEPGSSAFVNPCVINGREYMISAEATYWPEDYEHKVLYNYYIEPMERVMHTDTLRAGSVVETLAMRKLRGKHVNVFLMGGNGGFKNAQELINQYDRMIAYSQSNRYIVMSFHMPLGAITTNKRLTEMEDSFLTHYGKHYINLRQYMVAHGMTEAGIEPKTADRDSIAHGSIPPSLLRDGKHFKGRVNKVMARLVYQKMRELGYIR